MALVKKPDIASRKLKRIVLMGGAMREGGNHSPAAEFNILVDPHAAHVVLTCGKPIVMMGLDVTHQVLGDAVNESTPFERSIIGRLARRPGC